MATGNKATSKDYSIILSPVVTEKTSHIGNGGNTVTFRVARCATKEEIKVAVERVFGKTVVAVKTVNQMGKPKRRMKEMGRTPSFKKAYVTLAQGQTIDVVEGA